MNLMVWVSLFGCCRKKTGIMWQFEPLAVTRTIGSFWSFVIFFWSAELIQCCGNDGTYTCWQIHQSSIKELNLWSYLKFEKKTSLYCSNFILRIYFLDKQQWNHEQKLEKSVKQDFVYILFKKTCFHTKCKAVMKVFCLSLSC